MKGWPRRLTDIILGEEVDLADYIRFHEGGGGKTVHVYTFCTSPKEESEIYDRIIKQPTAVSGGLCAQEVRHVIAGIGPFSKIGTGWITPKALEEKVIDAAKP